MRKNVYALLVGIDAYPRPMSSLGGCVQDILSIEAVLKDRAEASGDELACRRLLNAEATRASVLEGLERHLTQAGPDDVALFYYSGHGSQQPVPPEFQHLSPDRECETLVCVDSRTEGQSDLFDKELAVCIAKIAERAGHVLVILDSCHSGSGTRDPKSTGVRRAAQDQRKPDAEKFANMIAAAGTLGDRGGTDHESKRIFMLPRGRHVLLAACGSHEQANEMAARRGTTRGVFSHFLVEALARSPDMPTYRDLFNQVHSQVVRFVAKQCPLIQSAADEDFDRPFLGGDVVKHERHYTATQVKYGHWKIDAGQIQGFRQPAAGEATQLALFESSASSFSDLSRSIGSAVLISTSPAQSTIDLSLAEEQSPGDETIFKAIVTSWPLPPLSVALFGDERGIAQMRAAIARAGPGGATSLFVRENASGATFGVQSEPDRFRISRLPGTRPVCADVARFNEESASMTVARLEHIARWQQLASRTHSAEELSKDAIEMTVLHGTFDDRSPSEKMLEGGSASEMRFDYRRVGDDWVPAPFKIRLRNKSRQRLYCMLLNLTPGFGIRPLALSGSVGGSGRWLSAGGEVCIGDAKAVMRAEVPNDLWQLGCTETRDILKLIVSTEASDATLMAQENLDARSRPGILVRAKSAPISPVGRGARDVVEGPGSFAPLAGWTTTDLTLIVRRLPDQVMLTTDPVMVAPNVEIQGHAKFKGIARLASSRAGARSAASDGLSPMLGCPLDLAFAPGAETSLSMLELEVSSDKAHLDVSVDAPLVIKIQAALEENEHVLPVGFDGEFYLPLGSAKRVDGGLEVTLDRLPKPIVTRSLTSAIRILFEKIVGDHLGTTYRYPLLSVVEADARRIDDIDAVGIRVKDATRVLLYVHGIIGDTIGMAASAFAPLPTADGAAHRISERYDLVLAFDYENLKTPIEQSAIDLKRRLQQVGLGEGHGKTLHMVAHSMGGLISRWFIEREGGNASVQKLVMLGTPNAGSPWPTIESWATTALAFCLNGMAPVAWPARVLADLVIALRYAGVALGQMKNGSQFLETLSASADPKVAYVILAGNTSTIRSNGACEGAEMSRVQRLLERLSPCALLHGVTGMAFFREPNDIAVSVASVCAIPGSREPAVATSEVASDHVSYFTTPSALVAIDQALR
jgi:pimeloyl-ACP methyl ester carboxylesterase